MVPRDPEVRDHDPELALYSGADGLDLIRVISRAGLALVRPGGLLVLEHAETQGAAIRGLLAADGWESAETRPDLTGRDRATLARR
jgi:release factor glutamine methyltransferase